MRCNSVPADPEENPHRLTDLGVEWMQLAQRARRAVQHEILRALVQKLLDAELGAAVLAVRDIGVDFALHHIKLAIDGRQTAFGLDEDESVMPLAMCSATIGVAQW